MAVVDVCKPVCVCLCSCSGRLVWSGRRGGSREWQDNANSDEAKAKSSFVHLRLHGLSGHCIVAGGLAKVEHLAGS